MNQPLPLPSNSHDRGQAVFSSGAAQAKSETRRRESTFRTDPAQSSVNAQETVASDETLEATLGPYCILEKLGQGSMGSVFKARHLHLGKLVAIKVLPAGRIRRADLVSRFKREMKAGGKLSHPHIVQAFDAGEIDGTLYLAMEFVAGTDLHKRVQNGGPLSVADACDFVRQAALALDAAHRAGLVHRDVKPANLLLADSGQVKLLDLGLALLVDDPGNGTEVTLAGETFGTPDYMSPEQWDGAHSSDGRTDLYALGCTLFYLLVGRAPFATAEHATYVSKMKAHVLAPIPDLKAARPDAPDSVIAIYERLLAKHPAKRFQSGADLAEALACALQWPPVASRARTAPADNRVRIRATIACTAVAACMVFATLAVNQFLGGLAASSDDAPLTADVLESAALSPEPPAGWHDWPAGSPPPALAPFSADQARQYQEAWAGYLQLPVEITNTIGMKLTLIPPGEFLMGSTPEEIADAIRRIEDPEDKVWQDCMRSEGPQHPVVLTRPFYLGIYEVTQREYLSVMGENPSDTPMFGSDAPPPTAGPDRRRGCPVDSVHWDDAVRFCSRLSEKEQLPEAYLAGAAPPSLSDAAGYRLPTEAEWEFACRAGTQTEFWIGNTNHELKRAAWFDGNAGGGPHTVGTLLPNPFGLFDMHGNLYEWVHDQYDAAYYSQFVDAPAVNPSGPIGGMRHVLRGGYCNNAADHCRSANRWAEGPRARLPRNYGFRVALPLEAARQLQNNFPPTEMAGTVNDSDRLVSDD